MAQSKSSTFDFDSISGLAWLAIALVFITGLLHLYSGVVEGRIPVLLAGVGFLGAIVLFVMNYRRRQIYLVGIVYTAVQIPLWYVANVGEFTMVGYVDKVVQVALIILLAYLYWQSSPARAERLDASHAD